MSATWREHIITDFHTKIFFDKLLQGKIYTEMHFNTSNGFVTATEPLLLIDNQCYAAVTNNKLPPDEGGGGGGVSRF